ncbi:hypothetical protein ACHQM5_001712 [Ranunculus cassubicifolius]
MDYDLVHRYLRQEQRGVLLQLVSESSDPVTLSSTMPPTVRFLVSKFSDIFGIPTSLPPNRSHDHHIPLLSGSSPVNVRPYRYPYFQKSEIEKVVKELREAGLIRPSSSPYSSPVLLVRKKRQLMADVH